MTSVVTAGLTDAEVARRVAEGKTNDVPTRAARSVSDIVRANVFTRINAILGVLLIISGIVYYVMIGGAEDRDMPARALALTGIILMFGAIYGSAVEHTHRFVCLSLPTRVQQWQSRPRGTQGADRRHRICTPESRPAAC